MGSTIAYTRLFTRMKGDIQLVISSIQFKSVKAIDMLEGDFVEDVKAANVKTEPLASIQKYTKVYIVENMKMNVVNIPMKGFVTRISGIIRPR
jgi:hypothetical protein